MSPPVAAHRRADAAPLTGTKHRLPSTEAVRRDEVWDLPTGAPARLLTGFNRENTSDRLPLSPDGSLAVARTHRLVELLDWKTDRMVLLKEAPIGADFTSAGFTPDGKVLVTGHQDGTVHFWDVPTGRGRATFKAHDGGPVAAVDVSADKRMLATGFGSEVVLWDLNVVFPRKE